MFFSLPATRSQGERFGGAKPQFHLRFGELTFGFNNTLVQRKKKCIYGQKAKINIWIKSTQGYRCIIFEEKTKYSKTLVPVFWPSLFFCINSNHSWKKISVSLLYLGIEGGYHLILSLAIRAKYISKHKTKLYFDRKYEAKHHQHLSYTWTWTIEQSPQSPCPESMIWGSSRLADGFIKAIR